MYLELFKLNELPFRTSPDPQFLYLSRQHAKAKACMESTVYLMDNFAVITGEIGAGKTTLIESFLKELPTDVVAAVVNQTQLSSIAFLQSVLVQFGFSPFRMRKAELLATITSFLIDQYTAGRRVLLIVDEAQNLSTRVLEEVRLLSGVETTKDKVLRIILAGQPELNAKLAAPELTQLAQRIRLRAHISALSQVDMREYIQSRLAVAGSGERVIFTESTFPEIYRYTGGVPRLVNLLCDTAMMVAFAGGSDTVAASHVKTAVNELQWVDYRVRQQVLPAVQHLPTASPEPDALQVGRLVVTFDGRTVQDLPVYAGRRIVVGRTPDNDLQLDSRFISRHHCQVIATDNACYIQDLNSTNGIYVRKPAAGPSADSTVRVQRHLLADGDTVLVGQHELTFHAKAGDNRLGSRTMTVPGARLPPDASNEEVIADGGPAAITQLPWASKVMDDDDEAVAKLP